MHLDRKFGIILAFSLVWGLVVSLFFYRMTMGGRAAGNEKVLVVAAQPLSPGASISVGAVKTIRVPENLFPRGGFSKVDEVVGRPVISSIQPDEPVVESRIAPRGSGFGVAPLIPPGMRAQAVRVNDVAGVAGFVLPGMRVDVLVTGKPPGFDDTVTSTVLQNVTVLSAGQTTENDGKSQSISVTVVTLLVTPAQAESLTLATNDGHIQLVLRNSNDQQLSPTKGRQLRDLYARGEASPTVPAVRVVPSRPAEPRKMDAAPAVLITSPTVTAPVVQTMILVMGAQKTVETFPVKDGRKPGSAADPSLPRAEGVKHDR